MRLPPLVLSADLETWPLARAFTISRGSKDAALVLVARLAGGGYEGRGEAVPYARYGETPDSALAALLAIGNALAEGLDHRGLDRLLPAGAARNALDCALWDWRAKACGRPVHELLGLAAPQACRTAFTIGLDRPDAMADAARAAAGMGLLKLKLGDAAEDAARLEAVRRAAPDARLLVDANEGWSLEDLERLMPRLAALGVELVEQPLPAAADAVLAGRSWPVPLCADESAAPGTGPTALADRYRAVNIKLDKAGGLTAALLLAGEARAAGLDIFLGSMVATSLSIAPALLLAGQARWIDLDGPLLLARDREPGLRHEGDRILPAPAGLWGGG